MGTGEEVMWERGVEGRGRGGGGGVGEGSSKGGVGERSTARDWEEGVGQRGVGRGRPPVPYRLPSH